MSSQKPQTSTEGHMPDHSTPPGPAGGSNPQHPGDRNARTPGGSAPGSGPEATTATAPGPPQTTQTPGKKGMGWGCILPLLTLLGVIVAALLVWGGMTVYEELTAADGMLSGFGPPPPPSQPDPIAPLPAPAPAPGQTTPAPATPPAPAAVRAIATSCRIFPATPAQHAACMRQLCADPALRARLHEACLGT